jgi:hypothetical protein
MNQTGRAASRFFQKERKMKPFKQSLKYGAIVLTAAAAPFAAHAAIDLTTITNQFTAADVVTAVLAVAGVLAAIYATMTAAKMALRWIRGG